MFTIDRTISPKDAMFAGDEEHYLAVGCKAVEEIKRVVDKPATILDLPCGHVKVWPSGTTGIGVAPLSSGLSLLLALLKSSPFR